MFIVFLNKNVEYFLLYFPVKLVFKSVIFVTLNYLADKPGLAWFWLIMS